MMYLCKYVTKNQRAVIIGDSMLNNINDHGLSKSKEVNVLNFPGATIGDIENKIDEVLERNP